MTRHRVVTLRRPAFTLVELLVVIGIIALLISILLPSLQAARRSANSTKCLSSLRQLGIGFQMYANDHKGVWPVAEHDYRHPTKPLPSPKIIRWYNFLARYTSGNKNVGEDAVAIAELRNSSVIWGCPEWRFTTEYIPGDFTQAVRTGYGMQYYGGDYFVPPVTVAKFQTDYAIITPSGRGLYMKGTDFAKRASERGVIADSITHIINVPGFPAYEYTSITQWQPHNGDVGTPAFAAFFVDATRHAKPGSPQNDKRVGFNMLFCDGHASPVSVRDAWEAITLKGVPQ
jgi:prepilin-type N-terminal cleavage/methylation domain-containing protein/prepilin-type processing-associated H-X9-DG protein